MHTKLHFYINLDSHEASDEDAEEDMDDSDDDQALKPYECGVCPGVKFSTAEGLDKHVESVHTKSVTSLTKKSQKISQKSQRKTKEITAKVIDEVTDEFANEVANIEAKSVPSKTKVETNAKKIPSPMTNGTFSFSYF